MAVEIPFKRQLDFEYGVVATVAPGIRRVIANNPSPFTLYGTGTYLVGSGEVAVIDPGPPDEAHIDALLAALGGERISHILVTHTHMDHSPGCRLLKQATDAKTYAYGPHGAGKLEAGVTVEEGGDMEFEPDVRVADGEILAGNGWEMECVYTPGHTSNHMCFQFREQKALFTGDHIMGWSTSVISPPDGDMGEYMASLDKLLVRDDAVYWPTHGPAISDTHAHVRAFVAHRQEREAQILKCIDKDIGLIKEMVPMMYKDTPEFMYPAAARSVLASIDFLVRRGVLTTAGEVNIDAHFERAA